MSKELKEIISRCIANEQSAQMKLYNMFSAIVYSTCYRILRNSAEAEEVMQDSFIKVFERIKEYESTFEKIEFSLRRIAANGSIDLLRRRKINFISSDNIADLSTPPDYEPPEDAKYSSENVKKAINSLPEGYRLIITLKLIEQMNNKEIAQQMNITEATVRSQFLRARTKVKEFLIKIKI